MSKKPSRSQDLSVEIDFFLGLRHRMPHDVELLKILGDDLTKAGRYREGLEIDLELAKLSPRDPLVFYNLACSYSILDDVKQSAKSLAKAIKLGYSDVEWLNQDPDLKKLRASEEFQFICNLLPGISRKIG